MSGTVSIIVPVYDVQRYLRQCADSLLAQTYGDLEIILIDDGSPDACGAICDEYAAADRRVRVIHQQNKGLSGARNAGIDAATGSFLFFADSDDWIGPDTIEILLGDIIANDADISICGFAEEYRDSVNIPYTRDGVLCMDSEQAVERFCARDTFAVNAWGKLYKKKVFKDIRYPEGKIREDAYVILHLLLAADKITARSAPLYHYRQRKSGIIGNRKTAEFDPKLLHGHQAWKLNLEFIKTALPSQADDVEAIFFTSCITAAAGLVQCKGHKKFPDFIDIRRTLRKNTGVILKSAILDCKEKLLALSLSACPALFRCLLAAAARRRSALKLYD
jgi:glycosyltransferase involved in cell wall biosynthesis